MFDTDHLPGGPTMKKATARITDADRSGLTELEQIPNVGPAVAADLRRLGVNRPEELRGRDPYALYDELCRVTGQRHDPCLLDTFIAAVRFMGGEPARPWWAFTAERKRQLAAGRSSLPAD
jgi:hypothetical protein